MDWALWIGGGVACLVAGLLVGAFVGFKSAKDGYQNLLTDRHMRHSADLQSYFGVLRREVANQLIIRDPRKYVDLYERILWELDALGKADTARRDAELKIIADTYPIVTDFDIIGTRDYVLYSDSISADRELEKVYRDLRVYSTITRSVSGAKWLSAKWSPTTSSKELEHLEQYVKKLSDTHFRYKVAQSERSLRDFEAFIHPLYKIDGFSDLWYRAVEKTHGPNVKYATKDYIAQEVYLMPELGNGFTFVDDSSYGLTTFFAGNGDDFYVSIYRSDAGFKHQGRLDDLHLTHLPVRYESNDKEALGYRKS